MFFGRASITELLVVGGGIQAGLPTYKKVCVNLARERMILDLSTGFLFWLFVHPKSTWRVTLAAPLLQACSSLAFTLACHTCCSSFALTCPGQESLISQHSDTPMFLSVCMRSVPAHSQLLFALADHRGI
mmetsp:Transcript_99001/g.159637  ORF Transcript_99001/g.159637 Transcript_99001/m.159637 type:complete len:130 (+) Transcript_99001:31-420(+)